MEKKTFETIALMFCWKLINTPFVTDLIVQYKCSRRSNCSTQCNCLSFKLDKEFPLGTLMLIALSSLLSEVCESGMATKG